MRSLLFVALLVSVSVVLFFQLAETSKGRPLIVYTYSSITAEWGPGPVLEKDFEAVCECDVIFRSAGDANMILRQLEVLKGADFILGLDQLSLAQASRLFEWQEVAIAASDLRHEIYLEKFVPVDWAPMTFVRKRETQAPESLTEIRNAEWAGRIALQDPRGSSPGLQFLFWLTRNMDESEMRDVVRQVRGQAHSVSPGWSGSYGLFQSGQAEMVFSYTTSPVYHIVAENKNDVVAVRFREPLPVQVEYAAIPKTSRNPELARRFMEFLLSEKAQRAFMTKNYMLPVSRAVPIEGPYRAALEFDVLEVYVPTEQEIQTRLKIWKEADR